MEPGVRLMRWWRTFHESLLFVPTLMTVGALVLFGVTSSADNSSLLFQVFEALSGSFLGFLVFAGGTDSARSILAAIVSTWATIVGVVYSVTLVTIQLSATKYSAQVIPIFEKDRLNQIVLGSFTGTFVYALLVLKTVRSGEDTTFVPLIGINVAVVLALVSLFLLIAFIGNLAAYIRPTRFVDDYAASGIKALPSRCEPEGVDGYSIVDGEDGDADLDDDDKSVTVKTKLDGYVQNVDWGRVAKAVRSLDPMPSHVRVHATVASHLLEDEALVTLYGVESVPWRRQRMFRRAFRLDSAAGGRDPVQVLDTLADIGVTALSGGATDVGVSKASLEGIVRVTAAAIERAENATRFELDVGRKQVLLTREQDPFHESGLRALKRIMDKAVRQGYWDVAEAFTKHVGAILIKAARPGREDAWDDVMEWFRPIAAQFFEYDDQAARRTMLRHVRNASAQLRQADYEMRALDVEYALLEAARNAGFEDEALALIAAHGDA